MGRDKAQHDQQHAEHEALNAQLDPLKAELDDLRAQQHQWQVDHADMEEEARASAWQEFKTSYVRPTLDRIRAAIAAIKS